MLSDALRLPVRLKLSTRAIRTIEKNGGIDTYLLTTPNAKLTEDGVKLKRRIKKAQAATSASV